MVCKKCFKNNNDDDTMVKPREYKTLFHLEFVLDKVTYYDTRKTTNDETIVTVSHLDGQTLSIKETPNKTKRDYGEDNVTNIIFKYGKSGLFSATPSQLEKPCEVDLKVLRQYTSNVKISEGHCKITLGGIYSDLLKFSPNKYVKCVEDTRVFNDKKGIIRGCITFILKLSFYGKVKTAESECDLTILRFESNTEEEIILQMIPGDSEANWAMYNYTPRKKDMPNFDRYEDTFNFDGLSTASKQNLNEESKNAFPQIPPKLPEYVEKAFTGALKNKVGDLKPSTNAMNLEPIDKSVVQYLPDNLFPQNYNQFCENFPGADRYFENLAKANTERLIKNLKELADYEEQEMWKHQNQALLYQNQLHSIYPQGNGITPHMYANNPANYAMNINQNPPMCTYGVPNALPNQSLYINPYMSYYPYPPIPPPYGVKNKGFNVNVPYYPPGGICEDDLKKLGYKTNEKSLSYPGKPNCGYGPGRPQQQYSALPNRQDIVQHYQPNKTYTQGNALGNNLRLFYRNAQPSPMTNYAPVKIYGNPTVSTAQDKTAVQTTWITAKPKEISPPPQQSTDNKHVQNNQAYNKGRHHNLPPPSAGGNAHERRSQQTSYRCGNNVQDQLNGGHMANAFTQTKKGNTSPLPNSHYDPSFSKSKRYNNIHTKK